MRRTREEADRTRERLLDAAEQVFQRKGVSRTSLEDIAREAGLTRGALYWHFKDKGDIFAAIVDRLNAPLVALELAGADPGEPEPLARLREALLRIVHDIAYDPRRRRVYEIIFHKCELTEANQAIVDRHRRNYQDLAGRIRRLLENAQQQGQLPADFDARLATRQLQVQVTGLLYLWLLWDNPERMVAEASCLVDTYLDVLPLCYRSAPPSGQTRSAD
jgi:TetR/AcrR family acrAB operon transcriptional repressor